MMKDEHHGWVSAITPVHSPRCDDARSPLHYRPVSRLWRRCRYEALPSPFWPTRLPEQRRRILIKNTTKTRENRSFTDSRRTLRL